MLLCEWDGINSGQDLCERFICVSVWQRRSSYMMWNCKAHLCGISAQKSACEPHPKRSGYKICVVFCTELTYMLGLSGQDLCFEGELGALESHGNWPALSTGQGLYRAKGFSPPGDVNSCALWPCHSASGAIFCNCFAMVSSLNLSP